MAINQGGGTLWEFYTGGGEGGGDNFSDGTRPWCISNINDYSSIKQSRIIKSSINNIKGGSGIVGFHSRVKVVG